MPLFIVSPAIGHSVECRDDHPAKLVSLARWGAHGVVVAEGYRVPNQVRSAEFVWVPAGLLEADVEMRVVAHVHVASQAGWDSRPEGEACLTYEAAPQLDEFLAAIQRSARCRDATQKD